MKLLSFDVTAPVHKRRLEGSGETQAQAKTLQGVLSSVFQGDAAALSTTTSPSHPSAARCPQPICQKTKNLPIRILPNKSNRPSCWSYPRELRNMTARGSGFLLDTKTATLLLDDDNDDNGNDNDNDDNNNNSNSLDATDNKALMMMMMMIMATTTTTTTKSWLRLLELVYTHVCHQSACLVLPTVILPVVCGDRP